MINAPRVWDDRKELTVLLKEARAKAAVEHIVLLKSGEGIPASSGKSTLARKLAIELRNVRTGPHIELDLSTEGRNQVRDVGGMQREILRAVYPDSIESYTRNTRDELNQQYRALFSVATNGVLLLDNMSPKQTDLRKLMPPSESGWLTIVTTREPLPHLDVYKPMKVEIGAFGEESKVKKHAAASPPSLRCTLFTVDDAVKLRLETRIVGIMLAQVRFYIKHWAKTNRPGAEVDFDSDVITDAHRFFYCCELHEISMCVVADAFSAAGDRRTAELLRQKCLRHKN